MSDLIARKNLKIKDSSDAASKNIDATKEKLSALTPRSTGNENTREKSFSIRSGSALKTLKIKTAENKTETGLTATKPEWIINNSHDNNALFEEIETPQKSRPASAKISDRKRHFIGSLLGLLATSLWAGVVVHYVNSNTSWAEILSQQPHILGGFFAGILAPIALLWMILAYIQRGSDIQMYADSLRNDLQSMIFPTEEHSKVIHKDIEALCKQANELTTSSKTILNSIHKARVGLRHEIREFSGLSQKTEFHIDRLAENLGDKTEKLSSIVGNTDKSVGQWNNAMTEMLDKSAKIEQAMSKGSEAIALSGNHAEKIAEQVQSQLESGCKQLNKTVDSIKTIEDLNDKAIHIADTLNGSAASIEDAVEQVISKSDSFEERLDTHVNALSDTLLNMDNKIDNIERIGENSANKLTSAMVSAISGADKIGDSVRRAINTMSAANDQASEKANKITSQAAEKISEIQQASTTLGEKVNTIVGSVEGERKKMLEASNNISSQLEKMSESVKAQIGDIENAEASLQDRVNDMQIRLSLPIDQLNDAVNQANEKQIQIEEKLEKRIDDMKAASNNALENTKIIRDDLQVQTQDLSTLAGKMTGHAKTIQSSIKEQSHELTQTADQMLENMYSVDRAIKTKTGSLATTTQSAQENLSNLYDAMKEQFDVMQTQSRQIEERLNKLDQRIEVNSKNLIEQSEKASLSVENATSKMTQSVEIIQPLYTDATDKIEKAQQEFINMADTFEDGTASNLDKLKSMGILFDERLQALNSSAEDASKILDQSSDNLNERVNDIENATQMASDKIKTIEHTLKDQGTEIHLTTDQALIKINNVQDAIDQQSQDISTYIGQAIAQIEGAVERFSKQNQEIHQISGKTSTHLDDMGDKTRQQIELLSKTSKEASNDINSMVKNVQGEARSLLDTSVQALQGLKQTGEIFTLKAKELDQQMKVSLDRSTEYEQALNNQVDKMAHASEETANKITKAVSQLSNEMQEIEKTAEASQYKIEQSREKLIEETEHLADVSVKAAHVVDEAASSYVRQSTALFKATEDADQKIQKIRESDGQAQRSSFISSAKFVLESLHSLSIDLTRTMDHKDIPSSLWKTYQNGDIDIFTNRLASMMDDIDFAALKSKYTSDTEFRTYLNRFTRQYEELYSQASDNDHGALMATLFATSHIGRLYDSLCTISGRQSVYKKATFRTS